MSAHARLIGLVAEMGLEVGDQFAQRLLESTDQSVDHIASVAGFGTAAAMRLHFQSAVRTSPASYRNTFRTAAT